MLYLTPELFVDALILILYFPSEQSKELITKILEIYDKESESSTFTENDVLTFYVDLIRYIINRDFNINDESQKEIMLLKFKSYPLLSRDPEIYTILRKILTEPVTDIKRCEYIQKRLINAILWFDNIQMVKRMFGKLANGANLTEPEDQKKVLNEITEISSELVQRNQDTLGGETQEENRIYKVDFDDREAILKAFEIYNTISVYNRFQTGWQGLNRAFCGGFPMGSSIVHNSLSFGGKAVRNGTLVKIPGGWKPIEELKIGDKVIAQDGTISTVIGVFPQGKKSMFRVQFIDGRFSDVCGDHLWEIIRYSNYKLTHVKERVKKDVYEVLDTRTLFNRFNTVEFSRRNTRIPLCISEQSRDIELPIHPYILGVLLGDGCIGTKSINITSDRWICDKIATLLPDTLSIHEKPSSVGRYTSGYTVTCSITSKSKKHNTNTLVAELRKLGLTEKRSWEKFIPKIYFNGSTEQRLDLMRGLMDTDGICSIDDQREKYGKIYFGGMSFSTSSEQLAHDFQQLVWSVGGKCSCHTKATFYKKNDKTVPCRISYRLHPVYQDSREFFSLPRKRDRIIDRRLTKDKQLAITNISALPMKEECTCIAIDHPSKLFIIQDYIVTHNTMMLLKYVRWSFSLNVPPPGYNNPAILLYSLENETPQNTRQLFTELYINVKGVVPPADLSTEALVDFVYNEIKKSGWKLVVDRKLGADFGFVELVASFSEYVKAGYTPLVCIIDYINMMKKVDNGNNGNWLALKLLYTNICNFLKSKSCTMITAHQLTRSASELAAMYPIGAVKKFNMSHLAEGVDPQREIDIAIFQHIERDAAGRTFISFNMDKDRYDPILTEQRRYFSYMFRGPLGIPDDINGKDMSVSNINSVPFDDEDSYRVPIPGSEPPVEIITEEVVKESPPEKAYTLQEAVNQPSESKSATMLGL